MNRAKVGTGVAAICKSMQGNSDMRMMMIPGSHCCRGIDDYVRPQAMSMDRRSAAAAANIQELGPWVQRPDPSKVRQVKEVNVVQKLIKRRYYIPLVLTAFSPLNHSFFFTCMSL